MLNAFMLTLLPNSVLPATVKLLSSPTDLLKFALFPVNVKTFAFPDTLNAILEFSAIIILESQLEIDAITVKNAPFPNI